MNTLFSKRPGYGDLSGPNAHHDQRRTPRVVVSAEVSVYGDPDRAPERGQLINLSTDGAFVLTSNLIPVGSVLRLTLQFAGDTELSGTVRVRSRLPGRGNGVAFLSLTPEHRNAIEALMQRGRSDTVSPSPHAPSIYSY